MGYCSVTEIFCLLLCASFVASDIGYFWHVTDFHYDHTYSTAMLSCSDDVPKPGKYGDYWCDSPWLLVQDSISGMSSIKQDVDFIVWTGDSVAHIVDANLTLNLNLQIVENITEALNSSFLHVPVYASLGNHDFYPSNQAAYNESEIYVQVSKLWEDWIHNQSQIEQDSVAHIVDANLTLNLNLEIVENITEALNSSFPHVPVYASLGNHDFYPSNQAAYNESEMYVQVSKLWEDWIRNQSQIEQFREGGYYVARIAPKLRLLALNTNLYYKSNKLTANVDDPAGQMEWMADQLKDARSKGEKVIVTAHIPPSMQTPGLADWFYPKHKTPFVNILLDNSDVIVATMFGHDHSDGFKIVQDKTGTKAVTQFTAPSVTPWRYKTASMVTDAHNPGIRLVKYDRITGQHIDYEQYYINLTDSNSQQSTTWSRLYSFVEDYNVTDMSVASLRDIFSNMASDKGTEYSNKYCTYSIVSNYLKNCTDAQRAEIYCGGLNFDLKEAQDCKKKYLDRLNGASVHYLNSFIVFGVALAQISSLMLQ